MERRLRTLLAFALATLLPTGWGPAYAAGEMLADVYFENGIIYTVDAEDTVAEALAVKDGVIVFVGSAGEGAAYRAAAAEIVDLEGGMLLPGMIDGHIHIVSPELVDISLVGIETVDETMDVIARYVAENPDQEIYSGFGYLTSMFEGEELEKGPRKERLDAIMPDRPMVMASFDGHALWLNSAALAAIGVDAASQPPPGGQIPRDDATGEPWGTLKDSALALAPQIEIDPEMLAAGLKEYMAGLNEQGYTGIMTLAGNGFGMIPWEGLAALDSAGELNVRVHGGSIVTSWQVEDNLKTLAEQKEKYSTGLVRLTTAKLFADGVMDNDSALLLAPYSNNPHSHGDTGWTPEAMGEAVAAVNALGIQAHTHAIGDGGARMALDAIEYARAHTPAGDYRNAITHLQLVAPEDVERFAALDVVAVPQPFWHYKQPNYFETIEKGALGDRAEHEYPLRSFLDAGVTLAFASDFPVTTNINPFIAIEAAVTRNLPDGSEYDVPDITDMDDPTYLLGPGERIGVRDAIRAFTAGGAYAMFAEDRTGTLEVGKSADMIVIDRDLLRCDPLDISDTNVLRTYIEGRLVYDAGAIKNPHDY